MIIRTEILDLKTNETVKIEKKGSRIPVLLAFAQAIKKYKDKDHKIIKVESDDSTVLTELSSHYPNIHMEYIEPITDST